MKIIIDTKKRRIRYKKCRREPFYNEEILRRLLVRVCAKYIRHKGSKEYVIDEFAKDIKKEVKSQLLRFGGVEYGREEEKDN